MWRICHSQHAPLFICAGVKYVSLSLSLSASGLPRNRFRIGYVYTPRGFLLRHNDLKGLGRVAQRFQLEKWHGWIMARFAQRMILIRSDVCFV